MIDLGEGILEEFAEKQQRFAVWMIPLSRTTPFTQRVLSRAATPGTRVSRCGGCGRRGHKSATCLYREEWND